MFFRDAFLDLVLLYFMLIFSEKGRFWDPIPDPPGPKMAPKFASFSQDVNFGAVPRSRFYISVPTLAHFASQYAQKIGGAQLLRFLMYI